MLPRDFEPEMLGSSQFQEYWGQTGASKKEKAVVWTQGANSFCSK